MKKLLFLAAIIILTVSCNKTKLAPIGPTDIRINNLTDQVMTELTVNTSGGTFNYGTLNATSVSVYHQFEKAYTKAEITASIGGEVYTTGAVDYTGLTYLSTVKATYKVKIKSGAVRTLEIFDVILEEPLK